MDYMQNHHIHRRRKELVKGFKTSTCGKTIKQLRIFLTNRMRKKIISTIDLEEFKIVDEATDAIYLDLKFMLYSVIPMMVATNHGFADWVVQHNHNIDSYDNYRTSEGHCKKIEEAVKKIKDDFKPVISITVTSERYNIDLVHYYIGLLEMNAFTVAKRQYRIGQRDERMYGVEQWKTWSKEVLWHNVQLFLQQFYRLYSDYIRVHFPHLVEFLTVVASNEITIVHLFHFSELHTSRPYMEVYHLRPAKRETGKVLCYLAEDPFNPIDRKRFGLENKCDCMITGEKYEILSMHVQTIEFMFARSPLYQLINDKLTNALKKFFHSRTQMLKWKTHANYPNLKANN